MYARPPRYVDGLPRPGRWVIPVIRTLVEAGAVDSVDTMSAEVADAALESGAVLVNDVSGGLADPEILSVVARHGAAYAAMHWRARADTMQKHAEYDDVVVDVAKELSCASTLPSPPGSMATASRSIRDWVSPRPLRTTGPFEPQDVPGQSARRRGW